MSVCEAAVRRQARSGTIKTTGINSVVALDLVGPIESTNGKQWILMVMDQGTGRLAAAHINNKYPDTVRDEFRRVWVSVFGLPKTVKTDQGTEFQGTFAEYLKDNNIMYVLSPVARPQANGKLENRHKDLVVVVKALLMDKNLDSSS